MLKMPADRIVLTVRELTRITTTAFNVVKDGEGTTIARRIFEGYKSMTEEFLIHCQELGLPMCAASADRLLLVMERIRQKNLDPQRPNVEIHPIDLRPMKLYMDEIIGRAHDELATRKVLVLRTDLAHYFEPTPKPLFGSEVHGKFQSAAFDIAEAGNCMACERSTATVFHVMRALEVGVTAVATCLSIPSPVKIQDKNWGSILKAIRKEIDRRDAAQPKAWIDPKDPTFFDEAYALLDAVKNVWRNATMHIENKYTPDEAHLIFTASRGFMKKLASRMDEHGDPKA